MPPQAASTPQAPVPSAEPSSPGQAAGGARATFQPAPIIPPELRRRSFAFVAVVRFAIAIDGSAIPSLEEATPDPALNGVLLDTFKRWRFFPAVSNGKPAASVLVLRVPISVQ